MPLRAPALDPRALTLDASHVSRMLMVDSYGERFLYRVAGVALVDGRLLVQQFEGETFWCLPGGRVEMGEPAEEALAREMREELGCEVRIGRLLWVIDNFFRHRRVDHHELGLYFAITLPEGSSQVSGEPWTGSEDVGLAENETLELHFSWQPIDELPTLDIKPSCLREMLRELPAHPVYMLHRDE
jgi:8-oxo-dGTP pyrophosphatase MutT (NUDIX family)